MSRADTRKPEFRLRLGYPEITLVEAGSGRILMRARPDDPGFAVQLRQMAYTARDGRLTAILPEDATWRHDLPIARENRRGLRQRAEDAAAGALNKPAGALVISVGADSSDHVPVAAVSRSVLGEARGFLRKNGLFPVEITASPSLPGFRETRLRDFVLPPMARTPVVRAAAGGLTAALAVWFLALPGDGPVERPEPEQRVSIAPVVTESPPSEESAAPLHRPADLVPRRTIPESAIAALPKRPDRINPAQREAANAQPFTVPAAAPVTVASRSAPQVVEPSSFAQIRSTDRTDYALPGLQAARERIAATLRHTPLLRVAQPKAVLGTDPAQKLAELRPVERPVISDAVTIATPLATASSAPVSFGDLRPRPRPGTLAGAGTTAASTLSAAITEAIASVAAEPVRTASLGATSALVAAPRPAPRRIAARSVATPKPTFEPQAPTVTRTAPAVVRSVPVAQPPAPKPTPKVVVAKPAPVVPRATPARPAPQNVGLRRNEISLVGVFGSPSERRAILRLPNGKMTKVQAGDRVDGARVAAVGSDSVRLSGRSQDVLLKLP